MSVNVPLVHISELTEQTTASDNDYMVIGGSDAKKITWGNIAKLILAKITGAASTILTANLSANRALVSNGNGKVSSSSVTETELSYLSKAKSNIQAQIDDLNTKIDDEIYSGTFYGAIVKIRRISVYAISVSIRGTLTSTLSAGTHTLCNITGFDGLSGSFVSDRGATGYIAGTSTGINLVLRTELSGYAVLSTVMVRATF